VGEESLPPNNVSVPGGRGVYFQARVFVSFFGKRKNIQLASLAKMFLKVGGRQTLPQIFHEGGAARL